MGYIFIGVYIVLGVLVYVMFRVLKNSVDKIGNQSKAYYVEKLQEYDDLISDKEQKLNNLNEEIKNKKVEAENLISAKSNEPGEFDMSIIDSLTKANYKDKSLFELEKTVNEKWNYDSEKIILEFLKNIDNTVKNASFCRNLRKKFNNKKLYEYKILTDDELDVTLKNVLSDKEYTLLDYYKKTNEKFILDEFIIYLDELISLNNPELVVYTGNKGENYDHLNKYITTKYDKNIYRGIKILYQGKIYDFSLNGGNL